jgi:hypothetical protein
MKLYDYHPIDGLSERPAVQGALFLGAFIKVIKVTEQIVSLLKGRISFVSHIGTLALEGL